jgi:dephospho-CoA kinase
MKKQKVITIAGMPGAGKGFVSSAASARGIPVFVCGDVIREETARRGLPPTPENMGAVMLDIRQQEGPAVVAERLIPKLEASSSQMGIVEGVRSMAEVDALRKHHAVTIVAVHASPKTRYDRLVKRGRSDDPKSWEEFLDRDSRELGVGIGNVIALAQEMLVNEGSAEDFQAASERVVSKVVEK